MRNLISFLGVSEFQDVQYGDIDIMDRRLDFTYDPVRFAGLPEYVEELKERGIKFMTILASNKRFSEILKFA